MKNQGIKLRSSPASSQVSGARGIAFTGSKLKSGCYPAIISRCFSSSCGAASLFLIYIYIFFDLELWIVKAIDHWHLNILNPSTFLWNLRGLERNSELVRFECLLYIICIIYPKMHILDSDGVLRCLSSRRWSDANQITVWTMANHANHMSLALHIYVGAVTWESIFYYYDYYLILFLYWVIYIQYPYRFHTSIVCNINVCHTHTSIVNLTSTYTSHRIADRTIQCIYLYWHSDHDNHNNKWIFE